MRLLAVVVWPFAVVDAWLTDRRIDQARREHARDTAAIEAASHGTYFRTPDPDLDWCD